MMPGKPFTVSYIKRDDRLIYIFGLAGNPVSSLVGLELFIIPFIKLF